MPRGTGKTSAVCCAAEQDRAPIDALLINPPWISNDHNIWHGIKASMPPLGLLSIAAFAERAGFTVRILDLHVERWTIAQFEDYLRTIRPRVAGITMMTATAIAANRVAQIVRRHHENATIVVGGVHAESMPTECLRNSAIDIVVRGDGEETFNQLLAGVARHSIRGISYRRGNNAVHNPAADVIADLDSLPMPAYHLVPMDKYHPALGAYRKLPAVNMLMTRGCPGKCTFCNSAETQLRARSADLVVEEIALLRRTYGIREIQFYDDTFTVLRKNCLRFCRLMKERKLGVSWTAFVRCDCFNAEMAKALKEAGCHQVMFGVESGDDEILRNIRKPIDKARTLEAIRLAKRFKLEVRATFMLGNPGETVESMQRTIDYAVSLDPDLALFNITTPYPGTQMFAWAKERGYLETEDWGQYELSNTIMRLPTVTYNEIREAYDRAHRTFYRRAVVAWRRAKRIRNIDQLLDNIRGFLYIVARFNVFHRDANRREWIAGVKEDFWNVPLIDPRMENRLIRTNQVAALSFEAPTSDRFEDGRQIRRDRLTIPLPVHSATA